MQSRGRVERRPDLFARFQAALPLLIVYFAFAALYSWQASRRPVPTTFTDELELTQLARSIASTGHPSRLGEPYGMASLVAYLLAPIWWLGTTTSAYAAGKLLLVLTMTSAVFPAYGLARMVTPRWYALAAAAASIALPALTYAPFFVEEPLAYPLATLALWLIARLVAKPSWGRFAGAFAVCALGALTRTQLAVLFAVLALGLVWLAWDSKPALRWRSSWTAWDWAGAVALVLGVVLGFSALMGHLSTSWRNTTFIYKGRILDHATWSLGALAIGMGVLPLVIGVAALARPKDEPRDPETRAFVVVATSALAAFVWYAGIKGAYLSTVFATYVYERNLIYLAPILLAATAMAFARGSGRGWAIGLAAVVTVYVVNAVPVVLRYPYYEAHGLAILAFANRELSWSEARIDRALLVTSLIAVAVAVALRFVRRGSPALVALAAVSALVVVTWSMTTEVYAAQGERTFSHDVDERLPQPLNWVDRATGGRSVVVLGQQITDPTGVQETEFFNHSIRKIWSLDGTAISVGAPILTPDLDATDGTLTPSPGTEYALGMNGVNIRAPEVTRHGDAVLYKLDGPIRLRDALIGRESDGWIVATGDDDVAHGSYTRYDVSGDGPGLALVTLSRDNWCPSPGQRQTATATVRIGPVGIGSDKQPAIARVTGVRSFPVRDCEANGVALRVPRVPWRIEVSVSPTFVPREVDPSRSDNRRLGARFDARFQPLFGG